ncbi:unnamed protein product [Brachionus calyciflorus]|uniref:Microtubule-associated protein n=1 Tax=Brachionus calyciflorus TaxID=104777 RepID=A0A813MA03_9BILA|nr:unnamed protein product [Brachionus calyciflorus]
MTYTNDPESNGIQKFPDINQSKTYPEKISQEKTLRFPPINQKSQDFQRNVTRKPVKLGYSTKLNLESPQNFDTTERREETSLSQESTRSKKIVKWHMWWDKSNSQVRVPTYALPPKEVPSKIGSLEKINHKPGGGNVSFLDEKLRWKKMARIDHIAKGYAPGGGNRKILNEKLNWKTSAKIGSLENANHVPGGGNIAIIDQPFNKNGIRPRIDSGFIYEETYVPINYVVKTTPRTPNLEAIHETLRNHRSIKN